MPVDPKRGGRVTSTKRQGGAAALAVVAAAAVIGTAPAEAGSRRCFETDSGRVVCRKAEHSTDRRSAAEREYDRARANDVDPGGSYSAYPDWARYALSPKGYR